MKTAFFLLISLFFVPHIHAQELNSETPIQIDHNFSRKIIVQTDFEEAIPNHEINCRIIPKKLGIIEENEVTTKQLTTNQNGEAILGIEDNTEIMVNCSSIEMTNKDYCWFFPNSTITFDIYNDDSKNEPIYLIAQESPDTCGKEFSQEELENGFSVLVPQGTAFPLSHSKLSPDLSKIVLEKQDIKTIEIDNEITLWQWIVQKFNSLFNL